MQEIVRYRVARSPYRRAENSKAVYRLLRDGDEPSPFLTAVRNAIGVFAGNRNNDTRRIAFATAIRNAFVAATTNQQPALGPVLRALDIAILKFVPAPTPAEFEKVLEEVVKKHPLDLPQEGGQRISERLTKSSGWSGMRTLLSDYLVYLHIARADVFQNRGEEVIGDMEPTSVVNRYLLLMGVIEALADGEPKLATATDVADLLFRRTVLLPSPPFPLQRSIPELAATHFARRPAFVDLKVVRDVWYCYVAGEIAHIENVLKGELKKRSEHQFDETEVTDTRDDSSLQVHEDQSDKTERSSFKEDVRRELQLSVAVHAQVDVSGSYGTLQFAAHAGAELQLGYAQTENRATEQSREVVERVTNRQEERVRKIRTERTLRRSEERNTHEINNVPGAGNVVGVYRWVDKITRLREFTYPHRYVFEFQLAEPGARLRWLQDNRPPAITQTPEPPFLTFNGKKDGTPVSPELINIGNYLELAGLFHATGMPEGQPDPIDVAGGIELKSEDKPPASRGGVGSVPRATGKVDLTIPPGYVATQLRATFVGVPELEKWDDAPASNNNFGNLTGYHVMLATASVGRTRVDLRNDSSTVRVAMLGPTADGVDMETVWNGRGNGVLSGETPLRLPIAQSATVMATLAGTYTGHATVALECELTAEARGDWQLAVYQRLLAAQQAWQSRYDDELQNQATQAGIAISGESDAKHRERIQEEIKRQVIELILARDFNGYNLMRPTDSIRGPLPAFDVLATATPTIQFLEQAFEWQNISYIPYEFFWSEREKWPTLERLRENDADWERFLRCGSARVVVPARPGFEYAVEYYAVFGEPWTGGAPPAPDDPQYVSVAQEIRELTGGGDRGEPGETMWETRVPTTLIWLDSDSSMPKFNDAVGKDFEGTPDPQLSPPKP